LGETGSDGELAVYACACVCAYGGYLCSPPTLPTHPPTHPPTHQVASLRKFAKGPQVVVVGQVLHALRVGVLDVKQRHLIRRGVCACARARVCDRERQMER
jgi:hypothetical protein